MNINKLHQHTPITKNHMIGMIKYLPIYIYIKKTTDNQSIKHITV